MLSITIAVCGDFNVICRAASIPFRFGMAMSATTTCGECVSVNCTASRPSPASATTLKSSRRSSSARIPLRITTWSSANRILIVLIARGFLEGERDCEQSASLNLRIDAKRAAQVGDALLHADQAETPFHLGPEAAAI